LARLIALLKSDRDPPYIDPLNGRSVHKDEILENLGKMGPAAASAAPAVADFLLKASVDHFLEIAIDTLGKMGPAAAPSAVPALLAIITGNYDRIGAVAAGAFKHFGSAGASAVPALVDALKARVAVRQERTFGVRFSVRNCAAQALANIGPSAVSAVPALVVALWDEDEEVQKMAAWALGKIGPAAASAVPELIAALNGRISVEAARALGSIGPSAASAVPALVKSLKDHDTEVQYFAAKALREIGPCAAPVLPDLLKLLKDGDFIDSERGAAKDHTVRSLPAAVIVDMGLAGPAVRALTETLGNPGNDHAIKALSKAIHDEAARMKDEVLTATIRDMENTQKALETELRRYPVNSKQIRSGAGSARGMLAALKKEQTRRLALNIPK